MKTKTSLLPFIALVFVGLNTYAAKQSVNITSIDVPNQYTNDRFIITFDQPMQRIVSNKIPISIKPTLKCYWTWIDHKNLSCDLNDYSNMDEDDDYDYSKDKKLQTATTYNVKFKQGLFDTNNNPLKAQTKKFTYDRPEFTNFKVLKWISATKPVLELSFNQKIKIKSLTKKLFLLSDNGEKIKLNITQDKILTKLKSKEYRYGDFYSVIVIPSKPLLNNTKYTVLIEKGIKSKEGKAKSLMQNAKETIQTPESFSLLGYECDNPKVYGKNTQGPCYVDDTIIVNFSSFITINSVYECQDTHIFTPKIYTQYGINFSQLYLKPSSNKQNYTNLTLLTDCINQLRDEFGRKIKTNNPIKIQTRGIRPSLSLNLPRNTLITDKQKIELFAISINLEKFYFHIDEINHNKIDKTYPISVQNKKDTKIKSLLSLTVPEKNIQSISGYVSIKEKIEEKDKQRWNPKIIPFSIQKSPYQINFRHNANYANIQINDIYTAKPIENTQLTFFHDNKPYLTKTNAMGIAQIIIDDGIDSDEYSVQLTYKNKTIKLINLSSFNTSINKKGQEKDYLTIPENSFESYGLTDKPVYRPGETVKFKFYLRQKKDKHHVISKEHHNLKVYVDYLGANCWDTYENCHSFYVKEKNQLDAFGGFNDEFTLPKNINNGRFAITYLMKNEKDSLYYESNLTFQVSNFKNSDYKLTLNSQQKYAKGREKIPVVATASYYSGGFVADEKGEIAGVINEKDIREAYPKYEGYNFGEFTENYQPFYLKNLSYDAKGKIHADYIPPKSDIQFGELKLNAGLKPKNGEWNYSSNLILPYRQKDYFLGLKFSSWSLQVNKTLSLENVLIDYKGEKHKAESITYTIKRKEDNKWNDSETLVCQNNEIKACKFKLKQSGSYALSAKATYQGENLNRQLQFYVINPYNNDAKYSKAKIEIFADKAKYKIGETANITLKFPLPNVHAFITTERNSVINSWIKRTSNGIIKLKLKITKKHAPGFDVSALIQQPDKVNSYDYLRNIDNNSLTIKVKEPKEKRLFSITTDKEIYTPKEKVKLTIKSNSDTSSNYVIAVIDQSIVDLVNTQYLYDLSELTYSQSKNNWDLMDASQLSPKNYQGMKFYLLNNLTNNTTARFLTLGTGGREELDRVAVTGSHINREDLGAYPQEIKRSDIEKPAPIISINREKAGAFIGNIAINKRDLRTLFADSAFFKTDVTIDANGEQTITFKLPDNITQWKIIVLGTDKSGRLAFNKTTIKASKDLELRSTLPLQVTQGDSFSAEFAVVSKKDKPVSIQAATQVKQNSLVINTLQTEFKNVDKLKSQTFSLPIDSIKQGDLKVSALVKTKQDADGILHKIAVRPAQVELSTSQYGQFDGKSKILYFSQPKNLASNSAHLSLNVSNSLLPNLKPVYDFIHDYPHACWEQQSAKAIITAIEVASDEKLTTKQALEKKHFVQNILNGAQDFQASNGGMAFFKASNERVNLFLSLYTLDNFEFLQKLGYTIPENVYLQLKDFSKKILMHPNTLDNGIARFEKNKLSPEIQLMALKYADGLDKKEIKKIKQSLFAIKGKLNLFALNQLLLAFKSELSEQGQILSVIADKFYNNDKKYTPKPTVYSYWYLLPSENKNQCDLISSQLKLDENLINKDDLLKHINGVLDRKNAEGDFGSTLENSYCAKALYNFSQKFEQDNLSNDYQFTVNNEIANGNKNTLETNVDLVQDLKVEINNSISQQSYYSATLKYPVKPESIKAQNHGFNLERQYFVFNDGKWQQAKQFRTGDWVKTVLTIHSPIGRKYVAVSNPVPGGWLPTDTALANNMPVGIRKSEKPSDNSHYFYEKQLNPATTRFYADYLPAGSYNISYYSQIRNAGTFIAMPAIVEEMYDDENQATTALSLIKIFPE